MIGINFDRKRIAEVGSRNSMKIFFAGVYYPYEVHSFEKNNSFTDYFNLIEAMVDDFCKACDEQFSAGNEWFDWGYAPIGGDVMRIETLPNK